MGKGAATDVAADTLDRIRAVPTRIEDAMDRVGKGARRFANSESIVVAPLPTLRHFHDRHDHLRIARGKHDVWTEDAR